MAAGGSLVSTIVEVTAIWALFDRLLVRPRSIVLQLVGHELALRRVGRLAQGMAVFAWGASQVQIDWSLFTLAFLIFTILSGVAFFTALLILQATLTIWTVESLEIMDTVTYGGVQMAQYPMDIYSAWFRRIFTYLIPLSCISYFLVLLIMGKAGLLGTPVIFQAAAPLLGFVFLAAILISFRFGIRRYTSAGS